MSSTIALGGDGHLNLDVHKERLDREGEMKDGSWSV